MGLNRRSIMHVVFATLGALRLSAQDSWSQPPDRRGAPFPRPDEDKDTKLPDGRSQKNAIAKEEHERAIKDAKELVALSTQLKDEIEKAGQYVVPVGSVKKTEDIERLARRIRGRLKNG